MSTIDDRSSSDSELGRYSTWSSDDPYGGIVTAGPFKGMRIDPKTSWGTGDIVPKLLGCYEAELAEALERLKAEPFDAVLNIGSAEGYYAIGSAMIVNAPKVIAMDIDPSAQAATARNAERNGVADKVECRGGIDAEGLAALLTALQLTRHDGSPVRGTVGLARRGPGTRPRL